MPKTETRAVWFLKQLGLDLRRTNGDEHACECPFCDRSNHFSLNVGKLVYNCVSCGERGNYPQLLGHMAELLAAEITGTDLARLAGDRRLPLNALKGYGFGFTGSFYTLPSRDFDGHVTNVLRYQLGGKVMSAPGCPQGLFGAQALADEDRAGEPVCICEGPWDAIALEWVKSKAGATGIVVAAPGASIFKAEWTRWFGGREVLLAYDNDDAGRKGMNRVISRLQGTARSIASFQWRPGDPASMDLRDVIVKEVARG